jgi:HD-GYP domain-containing protein (c-di-GMP phosphodiesterase class II)
MTTDRPYRRGLDPNVAVGRILEGRGKQFDPEFLDAMISALVRRGICDDPMEQQERKAA